MQRYIAFRRRTLQDDLDNTDLSLPEERKYLMSELADTKKSHSNYFRDTWNIIDVITYVLLFIVIVLHVMDICLHSFELALWIARYACRQWIRLIFSFLIFYTCLGGNICGSLFISLLVSANHCFWHLQPRPLHTECIFFLTVSPVE